MGLFARQKCAFFENHCSTVVFGRYQELLSMTPRGVWPSFMIMVWDAGGGLW